MNKKMLVTFIALAFTVFVAVVVYNVYLRPSSYPLPTNLPTASFIPTVSEKQKTIGITAKNGIFTPNTFQSQLFETLILNVTATDLDYTFQVAGYPRLDTQLPIGQTTMIKIQSLGVGEYPFICGSECTGIIIVEQENDADE